MTREGPSAAATKDKTSDVKLNLATYVTAAEEVNKLTSASRKSTLWLHPRKVEKSEKKSCERRFRKRTDRVESRTTERLRDELVWTRDANEVYRKLVNSVIR